MPSAPDKREEQDDTRLCPVCRMPISILAVRCRHCGGEVGRPRKEQETLTVKDLGGQAKTSYTISGNVMDALEAFRAEELTSQELERREREESPSSWFGHQRAGEGGSDPNLESDSGLPELDASNQDLASINIAGPLDGHQKNAGQPMQRPDAAMPLKLRGAPGAVLGLLAGLIVLGAAWFFLVQKDTAPIARGPLTVNQTRQMIEQGAPMLQVLDEANRALRIDESEENERIAAEARERFVHEIVNLLAIKPWRSSDLDHASETTTRAAMIDSSSTIKDLLKLVSGEVAAYSLVLSDVDVVGQRATFTLHNPGYHTDTETVRVNEMVQGRFLVKRISQKSVRVIDKKVPGHGAERVLLISLNGQTTGG